MPLWAYVLLCQLVGISSGWITRSGVRDWYPTLKKPAFNPPSWVFAPVWTTLYVLIAIAGFRVSQDGLCTGLFFLQLTLNGLWSYLFFGLRSPRSGLVGIVFLWATIALCVQAFKGVDIWAARLFWPYWAWVSFATLLNFEIWRLNRRP